MPPNLKELLRRKDHPNQMQLFQPKMSVYAELTSPQLRKPQLTSTMCSDRPAIDQNQSTAIITRVRSLEKGPSATEHSNFFKKEDILDNIPPGRIILPTQSQIAPSTRRSEFHSPDMNPLQMRRSKPISHTVCDRPQLSSNLISNNSSLAYHPLTTNSLHPRPPQPVKVNYKPFQKNIQDIKVSIMDVIGHQNDKENTNYNRRNRTFNRHLS